MVQLTKKQEEHIKQLVNDIRLKRGLLARRLLGAAEELCDHTETKFADPSYDIQLQFDYNPGNIPVEDESKLRFIMQVVQNQGMNALANAKQDFTRDSETWIAYFVRYPLLFNFRSRRSKVFEEHDFSLSVNAKLMDMLIDARAPADIKQAFKDALQDASGAVVSTTQKKTGLHYLVLMRSYDTASLLTIYRAVLKMDVARVKTLCGGVAKANLKLEYDEIIFEINNMLALSIYPLLCQEAVTTAMAFMKDFFVKFAEEESKKFNDWLNGLGKG